jgi:AcrR family transcriptional regulator
MLAGGPDAVAIEPLAAALGATKGSAYWHFPARADLLAAVLGRWRDIATTSVIDSVEARGGSPRDRLENLLVAVVRGIDRHPGELLTLSHGDPAVRETVAIVTRDRIAYVASLVEAGGVDAAEASRRALVAYSAYVGVAALTATVPAVLPSTAEGAAALRATLAALVLGD